MAIATNSLNYSTTATSTYTVKSNPSDVFVTATTPAVIKLGNAELSEDTLHKLLALLDIIEGADNSELNTLLSTVIALRKISA